MSQFKVIYKGQKTGDGRRKQYAVCSMQRQEAERSQESGDRCQKKKAGNSQ